MSHPSQINADLLKVLGFEPGSKVNSAEVEEARLKMCAALGLDTTLPDATLASLARKAGYKPAQTSASASAKPAVDPRDLANIGRKTSAGLKSVASLKTTQTSTTMRSLASKGTRTNLRPVEGSEGAVEGEPVAEQAAEEQAADQQAISSKLKQMTSGTIKPEQDGLGNKISGAIKKLFGR